LTIAAGCAGSGASDDTSPGVLSVKSLDPAAGVTLRWQRGDTALALVTRRDDGVLESRIRLEGSDVETRVVVPDTGVVEPMEQLQRSAWEAVLHADRAAVIYFRDPDRQRARLDLWHDALVDVVPRFWEDAQGTPLELDLSSLYLHELVVQGLADDW